MLCTDISDPRQHVPKTFRHHQTVPEVYGQFGTSVVVGEVMKCESAKVNMYKMRKFDAKDFAFYTSLV